MPYPYVTLRPQLTQRVFPWKRRLGQHVPSYVTVGPRRQLTQRVFPWKRRLGSITVTRDDGGVLTLVQATGAMADAGKPWSNSFVPPAGTGPIPDALRARMKAAVDQADAWQTWSQHYGLNWGVYRTPASGAPVIVQQATASGTPVLVQTSALPVTQAPPQVQANGNGVVTTVHVSSVTPPGAPAGSWFDGTTDLFGVQVPNTALLVGGAFLALMLLGGDEGRRR